VSHTCPGRGAAFFTMHRRAGTHISLGMDPGSAAHHAAKSGALRSIRGKMPCRFSRIQFARQVAPIRIELFNQCNLPISTPALQGAFSRPRFEDRIERFKINELIDLVSTRESDDKLCFVLQQSPREVVGNADIRCPVRLVCENVDEERHIRTTKARAGSGLPGPSATNWRWSIRCRPTSDESDCAG
jgi:hypothetical protein